MDYKEKLKSSVCPGTERREEGRMESGRWDFFHYSSFFSPAPHLRDLPYHHKFSNTTQTYSASYPSTNTGPTGTNIAMLCFQW